ncbi:hypothetical protein DFQ26_008909 [Actinomortierella ambigua]|nr:hypothetical protein DFQ26_008909 [Actinomortierella ambigua]
MEKKANRQPAKESARATRPRQVKTIYGPADMEHQVAIRFNPQKVSEAELYLALFSQWQPSEELTKYSHGIGYYAFSSQQDKEYAMANPLKIRTGAVLHAHLLKTTEGKTIRIRAENAPLFSTAKYKEEIVKLFQPVPDCRILEFSQIPIPPEYDTGDRSSYEFVLEIPYATPLETVKLPRVAVMQGRNVVFSWRGVKFCYHCAAPDHLKKDCPLPRSANIRKAKLAGTIYDHAIDSPTRRLESKLAALTLHHNDPDQGNYQ